MFFWGKTSGLEGGGVDLFNAFQFAKAFIQFPRTFEVYLLGWPYPHR
jgi:hypothetical protein